jgi:hypothetical protein
VIDDHVQVMDCTLSNLRPVPTGQQQVFRARFSAITAPEIRTAMVGRGAEGASSHIHSVMKLSHN